ncbi:alpha-lactalbumin [Erinaceus europaeus]|uniref:Alpha-lactalbumin n=1 Tax=Erinaceus europaeus TaxID=9365 RepID=A0A1S2ZA98_ERIEU|nr:alpha-lactalbumin [Erinaceus europaeus]
MKAILLLSVFSYFFAAYEARIWSRCELAHYLKTSGLAAYSGYDLAHWICLIQHQSNFNTRTLIKRNSDGSSDYGLFQLNSRRWCKESNYSSTNTCNTACSKFLDGNIDDDIRCAKKVVTEPNRMSAWVAWVRHCKGRNLSPYLASCNL